MAFLALNSLSLVIKMPSALPIPPPQPRPCTGRGTFHFRDLSPAVRGTKEVQSVLLALLFLKYL